MSRAHTITKYIQAYAERHTLVFVACLAACVGLFVMGAALALWALPLAPFSPELLKDIPGYDVSRLTVVQWSLFTALSSGLGFSILVACWSGAPAWLRFVALSGLVSRFAKVLERKADKGTSRSYWFVAGSVGLVVNVAMLWDLPIIACLEPDTIGYLQPSIIRSAGYMAFLQALEALVHDLRWVYPVQLNLMLLSFATLGWGVREHLHSWWAGVVVCTASMLSSGMLVLAPAIMAEAVFVALICFHLAAMLWAVKRPSWGALILAGLTVGLMIVVRPNGVSFVVSGVFLIYLLRAHWGRIVLGFGMPVAVLVIAQCTYNQATFGFFALHQFGGVSLVGNFSPLIRADMGGQYPDLNTGKYPDFNTALVDALNRYSHFPKMKDLSYPYEMARIAAITSPGSIYKVILPEIRRRLEIPEPTAVAFERDLRVNANAGALARAAIFNDPWGAFLIVTSNFIGNWHLTLPARVPMSIYFPRCVDMSTKLAAKHPSLVGAHTDVEFYKTDEITQTMKNIKGQGLRLIELPRLLISGVQMPLAYLAFGIAVFGFVTGLMKGRHASPELQVLSLSALSMMAGYGLISLGNTAFTRYTVVFDPVVFMMLAGFFVMATRWLTVQKI